MATHEQVQEVARAICRVAAGVECVMDEHPEREPCGYQNCRMVRIALEALEQAAVEGPRQPPRVSFRDVHGILKPRDQ